MEANNDNRRQRQRVAAAADNNNLHPSDNARLTYAEISQSPPQSPPTEEFLPEIHRAVTNPNDVMVLPSADSKGDAPPPICLMRRDGAEQAYALINKKKVSLNRRKPDWGCIRFAVIHHRVDDTVFQASPEDQAKFVAIKRLKKSVVAEYLKNEEGEENPYKDIVRMRELGDNVHVVKCVEALEDDEYLYIVTPMACEKGTLAAAIGKGIDPPCALDFFTQILRILTYLESKGICHRDFSPDNLIFLTPQRLVAIDLAMSVRVPVNENGQRTLIKPLGNFGTHPVMAPEIYCNLVFDGLGSDLWSATVLLYYMLTNQLLYYVPQPSDISFHFFLVARGLSSTPVNERTVQIMMDTFNSQEEAQRCHQHQLLVQSMAHLNLSRQARELFEHVFAIDASKRWTLAQVIESEYVLRRSDD